MNELIPGSMLYTYDQATDNIEIYRISRYQNSNTIVLRNKDDITIKISISEINNGTYRKIREDGILTFAIVDLPNNIQDVIVSLHRTYDLKQNILTPYYVCRQNVNDLFAEQIIKDNSITYVGMGMSKDNCPENVPFEIMLACDKVVESTTIAIYLDDTLEDMLSFIKTTKMDNVLSTIAAIAPPNVMGFETSLKQLLISNEFLYDIRKSFNIITIDTEIIYDQEELTLDNNIISIIEDIIKVKMINVHVIPFSRDIDISTITANHVNIADTTNRIYIITYVDGGYINRPYDHLLDHNERIALLKVRNKNHN